MAIAAAKSTPSPERTRPHALEGLRRRDGTIDWSPWYLTEEEDMGQSGEHAQIIDVLRSSLRELAKERDWSSVLVEADNFFAWVASETNVQVSPDLYVLDNPPPPEEPLPRRWEVWRPGQRPPRLAMEIVSSDWKKDYQINPARYDHLGVDELVLVDRDAFVRDLSSKGRVPFLIYRRTEEDQLELVYRGQGPTFCAEIAAYLVFQWSSPGRPRVRISRDPGGGDIVPTSEEAATVAQEAAAAAQSKAKEDVAAAQEAAAAAQSKAKEDVAAAQEAAAAAQSKAKEDVAAAQAKVAAAQAATTTAENKAAAAAEEATTAKAKIVAQAEEIALLRVRLRSLGDS